MKLKPFHGIHAFRTLWAGQSLSLLGTGMTRFAALLWAYEVAGTATALALVGFYACLTYVIASPFAGVLIDRWPRRRVLFFSDLGAGLMTAALLALYLSGKLEVWHLYVMVGAAGIGEAFQEPAFSASISVLVPRRDYTRSNALLGLGRSAARMFAPALAGLVMVRGGLGAVMVIDLLTMSLAMGSLLLIRIPAPPPSAVGRQAAGGMLHQMRFGFTYIFSRPGLRALLFTFFLVNLFGTLTYFAVHAPMILARPGGGQVSLGIVRTVMGLGGIAGGLLVTLWSRPRRKAHTYLLATMLSFLICDFITAISRSTFGWAAAGFISELTIPFIVAPYFALWQENVPPDVQGRVFATREMVQVTSQPLGYLVGGLLADSLFEPLMAGGGAFADLLSPLVGTGPGAGMAAMFLATSLLGGLTGLLGLLSPSIRSLDDETGQPEDVGKPLVAV